VADTDTTTLIDEAKLWRRMLEHELRHFANNNSGSLGPSIATTSSWKERCIQFGISAAMMQAGMRRMIKSALPHATPSMAQQLQLVLLGLAPFERMTRLYVPLQFKRALAAHGLFGRLCNVRLLECDKLVQTQWDGAAKRAPLVARTLSAWGLYSAAPHVSEHTSWIHANVALLQALFYDVLAGRCTMHSRYTFVSSDASVRGVPMTMSKFLARYKPLLGAELIELVHWASVWSHTLTRARISKSSAAKRRRRSSTRKLQQQRRRSNNRKASMLRSMRRTSSFLLNKEMHRAAQKQSRRASRNASDSLLRAECKAELRVLIDDAQTAASKARAMAEIAAAAAASTTSASSSSSSSSDLKQHSPPRKFGSSGSGSSC
jgi:hypothetical protein